MPIHFRVSRRALIDTFLRGPGNTSVRDAHARIALNKGVLTISSIGGSEELDVESTDIFDSGEMALNTANVVRNVPEHDPLLVQLEPETLQIDSLRIRLRPAEQKTSIEEAQRLAAAAKILASYHLGEPDLDFLVDKESSDFATQEQPLIDAIAKAWALLAPMAISPYDLKLLISDKTRRSWTHSSGFAVRPRCGLDCSNTPTHSRLITSLWYVRTSDGVEWLENTWQRPMGDKHEHQLEIGAGTAPRLDASSCRL